MENLNFYYKLSAAKKCLKICTFIAGGFVLAFLIMAIMIIFVSSSVDYFTFHVPFDKLFSNLFPPAKMLLFLSAVFGIVFTALCMFWLFINYTFKRGLKVFIKENEGKFSSFKYANRAFLEATTKAHKEVLTQKDARKLLEFLK